MEAALEEKFSDGHNGALILNPPGAAITDTITILEVLGAQGISKGTEEVAIKNIGFQMRHGDLHGGLGGRSPPLYI
jgi:hypothetical protein